MLFGGRDKWSASRSEVVLKCIARKLLSASRRQGKNVPGRSVEEGVVGGG